MNDRVNDERNILYYGQNEQTSGSTNSYIVVQTNNWKNKQFSERIKNSWMNESSTVILPVIFQRIEGQFVFPNNG